MKSRPRSKNIPKITITLLLALISFILIFILIRSISNKQIITGKVITEEKQLALFFFDNKSGCRINGEIYLGGIYQGNTTNGIIYLKEEDYEDKLTLSIFGRTGLCFNKDSNLPFFRSWEITNLNNFFNTEETLPFETNLNPRKPEFYEEMQDFIRPDEVQDHLNNLKRHFTNETESDLDIITKYRTRYRTDLLLFNQRDYWQYPSETLDLGHGDCEDWATTALSLIKAYDPYLKCYNVLWHTHISVFCYIDNTYVIYDQDETKHKTTLNDILPDFQNKAKLRSMRNNYFNNFNIKPNERKIYAVFNEQELITFNEDEDFIQWMYDLSGN